MLEKQEFVDGMREWNALGEQMKSDYVAKIDVSTDDGMRIILSAGSHFLDTLDWFKDMPGKAFYQECVRWVKMGNMGMPLGNMSGAWCASGFGMWAHLVPDIGIPLLMHAMHVMQKLGLQPDMPQHFPHLIYKPPGGSKLGAHHDQMSPMELLDKLAAHLQSEDTTTSAWVSKHGCQMLAHLRGGTGVNDGATYTIGPMTPQKLYVCLEAFSKGKLDGDYSAWNSQPSGKIDLNWAKHIDGFNRVLSIKGLDPIGMIPAAPGSADAYVQDMGHMLLFPVGWPHGSFANKNDEGLFGHGSRITVTMPITIKGSTQQTHPYIEPRIRNMAILATGGQSKEDYASAEAWLSTSRVLRPYAGKHKKQYADGPTHIRPEAICNLIRHPDAGRLLEKSIGPFHPISVKKETAAQFFEYCQQLVVQQVVPLQLSPSLPRQLQPSLPPPLAPSMPAKPHPSFMDRLDDVHTPPAITVLDDDVRLVHVQQPWATLLVMGLKDCENRRWHLKPSTGFPTWVLVVASKKTATKADLSEAERRLRLEGNGFAARYVGPPKWYDTNVIVGMIQICGCYATGTLPWPTVWHNPPDVAWMISDAWEFDEPVELYEGEAFQTQVALANRPTYRQRIEEEMTKLEKGLR